MATTRDCEVSFSFLSKDEQPNQTSWRCRTTKGIREWTWWMVWKDGRKATGAEGRRRWTEFGSRSVKVYLRRLHPRGREEKLEGRWVATSTWGRTTRTWWMFWTRGDGNNGSEGEEETMDSVWIKKFKLKLHVLTICSFHVYNQFPKFLYVVHVGVLFAEAEVSSRLGSTCMRRSVYMVSMFEPGLDVSFGRSLLACPRSVDSPVPRPDSCILYQEGGPDYSSPGDILYYLLKEESVQSCLMCAGAGVESYVVVLLG
ncbi:hypothetical protein BHE74_00018999 [Ensete ventricosum]|nr:hypothetical protein BHE74_00018999 [Ensete ventricosum]